jgi:hypothetical protein
MFIIWGSKGKESELARGQFTCPECGEKREYVHKRVDKYFTLYWMPIFKMGTLGEYIECTFCHNQFNNKVLEYSPADELQRIQMAIRHDLETGTPLKIAYRKLLNSDIEPAVASQLILSVCGDNVRTCGGCHATFIETVSKCAVCGAILQNLPLVEANEVNVSRLLPAAQATE